MGSRGIPTAAIVTNENDRNVLVQWSPRGSTATCQRCKWVEPVHSVSDGLASAAVLSHECSLPAMIQVLDKLTDDAERYAAIASRHEGDEAWSGYGEKAERFAKEAVELAAELQVEKEVEAAKAYLDKDHEDVCVNGHFGCANWEGGPCENELAGKYGLLDY